MYLVEVVRLDWIGFWIYLDYRASSIWDVGVYPIWGERQVKLDTKVWSLGKSLQE